MTRNTITFSDIDLNFSAHPVTGDITKRLDDSAINASIRNLVMTSNYERPFHSELGSQVRNLLFEPASPISKLMLEKSISQVIQNFEPRVVLLSVYARFSPENNSVYVTVEYKIINTNAIQTVNLTLKRTR
jgi:phage baseplate assembly protein W